MSGASPAAHLAALARQGLLTDEQEGAARAHPGFAALPHDASLGKVLAWLLTEGVLDGPGLLRIARQLDEAGTGAEAGRLRAALNEAAFTVAGRPNVNTAVFDTLVALGLITLPERHLALAASPPERAVAATPAAALVWMEYQRILNADRVARILAARGARRAGTVQRAFARDRSILWDGAHAGPPRPPGLLMRSLAWVFDKFGGVLIVLLFLGAIVGVVALTTKGPLPKCSDPIVLEKVRERLREPDLYPPGAGWGKPGKPEPVVDGITQIYARANPRYKWNADLRTCKADIKIRGTTVRYYKGTDVSYYFNIETSQYAWSGFTMTDFEVPAPPREYDPALDDPGAPLGRAELERALRAGMAELIATKPKSYLAFMIARARAGQAGGGRAYLRDGLGTIEPLGPCRGRAPPYRCRVRLQYYYPVGYPMTPEGLVTLTGEFSFGWRQEGWRTTPGLEDEMLGAIRALEAACPRRGGKPVCAAATANEPKKE